MDTRTGLRFETAAAGNPVSRDDRERILDKPGFGQHFSDHMVSARWTSESGWTDGRLGPHAAIPMDPAASILHYSQSIFEGFKAYRLPDGSVATFRPADNARRFQLSAQRLALPELPVDDFVAAADLLIATDRAWVPSQPESSLYIRPLLFGSERYLGVRPALEATFVVIASPVASYFAGGVRPVSIWVSERYTRAALGGTGAAKCGGNYAAGLIAQQEATAHECDQVVFLDAAEHRWVEELGGMNLFFVLRDGTLVTPELTGTILAGITRDSILTLGRDLGHEVEERRIGIDEWREGARTGEIAEVFACGTAAVVTPVGRLRWEGGEITMGEGRDFGPVTRRIRSTLLDIQFGRAADTHSWLHRVS